MGGVAVSGAPSPEDRVVVVLGASSGIGRAAARAFAAEGARLVLAARGRELLAEVAAECERDGATATHVVPTDVLDEKAVDALMSEAVARHGRIDVVVHSAAVMAYGFMEDLPTDVFTTVVDTTIHGTAHVARAAMPVFRRQREGTLVIVTSLLSSVPVPGMGAYITAKWGQEGLARVLQLEARSTPGVHVCTVAPGGVDTPIYQRAANYTGRVGQAPPPVDSPEKVARAIVRCADRPRRKVSVGLANPLIIAGFRLLPPVYDRLVTPLFKLFAQGQEIATHAGNVFTPSRAGGRDTETAPDEAPPAEVAGS